ncbi:low temperature requirement protein A [Microbacteriaceae bacterium VKM Ac-2855]|nr:low temperature requirement protein A [Microbacteriaceae bacterium VKM Ac-2855]
MTQRDPHEKHRASTPLELLFDLTFVAAIAVAGLELAGAIESGDVAAGIPGYIGVFFAIWWAWLNFSWFASAFDTDDVPYRLLTMVQMVGVLVLAAGISSAFDGDFGLIVVGYAVMRLGLVGQWIRAAAQDPTARRYALAEAVGLVVITSLWALRLLLPPEAGLASWLVLVALELALPVIATRFGEASWHPDHIAERYGLFTIIVLGESVVSAGRAFSAALSGGRVDDELIIVAVSAIVMLFGIWWLYFLVPAGRGLEAGLEAHTSSTFRFRFSYVWGYSHGVIFAAIAALGAAIEVAVAVTEGHGEVSDTVVAYAIAIPLVLAFTLIRLVHARLVTDRRASLAPLVVIDVVLLILPLATDALGLTVLIAALAMLVAALVALTLANNARLAA